MMSPSKLSVGTLERLISWSKGTSALSSNFKAVFFSQAFDAAWMMGA